MSIDPDRISIGGDSAGGQLAAAATLDLRGEAPLIAQVLIIHLLPIGIAHDHHIRENPDGPIVQPSDLVGQLYCPR